MLTKKGPATIPAKLTVKSQGEELTFNVTFHNRTADEVAAVLKDSNTIADALLFVIKDWEADFPLDKQNLTELEASRPGMAMALIDAFHKSRKAEVVKN